MLGVVHFCACLRAAPIARAQPVVTFCFCVFKFNQDREQQDLAHHDAVLSIVLQAWET